MDNRGTYDDCRSSWVRQHKIGRLPTFPEEKKGDLGERPYHQDFIRSKAHRLTPGATLLHLRVEHNLKTLIVIAFHKPLDLVALLEGVEVHHAPFFPPGVRSPLELSILCRALINIRPPLLIIQVRPFHCPGGGRKHRHHIREHFLPAWREERQGNCCRQAGQERRKRGLHRRVC